MEWYYVILIVLSSLILLVLLISFICFMMAFYTRNKKVKEDEITLPDDPVYTKFKDILIQDIKDARKLEHTKYSIKSQDGLTLKGKYYEKKKGLPIELLFHGYRSNAERDLSTGIKRAFLCDHNVFIVDQRGAGDSDGHVITFGIKERIDCILWVDFLIKTFGDDVEIILGGISMGASTVLSVSNHKFPKNVKAILGDCGYYSASEIIKNVVKKMHLPPKVIYPFIKLGARIYGGFNLEETTPLEAVKNSLYPILIIHGDKDELVPYEHSIILYNACSSTKKLVTIKDATHGVAYLYDPDIYIEGIKSFFN